MHESYTLTLAFIDYFIVALASIGLVFASKTIYQRSHSAGQTAFFGSLIIIIGAISSPTSKLLISFSNNDYLFLEELLWLLQGAGFTLVFAASLQWSLHASHKAPKVLPVLMATIVVATSLWTESAALGNQLNFFILLGATIVFFSGTLIIFAWHGIAKKLYLATSLLIISLCTNLLIQPPILTFDLIINTSWMPQSIAAVTQLFFAIGIWLIYSAESDNKKMPH
jgi:multisubunit Na+/H+ antiporter MnhG subunit